MIPEYDLIVAIAWTLRGTEDLAHDIGALFVAWQAFDRGEMSEVELHEQTPLLNSVLRRVHERVI